MANYAVTTWKSVISDLTTVLAAMDTQIETVVNTKTIRLFEVYHVGGGVYQGVMVYDT